MHQRVDALQTRFERAPDGDAAVGAGRRLDHLGSDQGGRHVGPFGGGELERAAAEMSARSTSASFWPASPA